MSFSHFLYWLNGLLGGALTNCHDHLLLLPSSISSRHIVPFQNCSSLYSLENHGKNQEAQSVSKL
jgi:hypothetical protein